MAQNTNTALTKLDPELQALYESEVVHEPIVEPRRQPSSAEPDALLELRAMAEANRKNAEARKNKAPGFDTVEHDVSNVVRLGWDFITRPLGKNEWRD